MCWGDVRPRWHYAWLLWPHRCQSENSGARCTFWVLFLKLRIPWTMVISKNMGGKTNWQKEQKEFISNAKEENVQLQNFDYPDCMFSVFMFSYATAGLPRVDLLWFEVLLGNAFVDNLLHLEPVDVRERHLVDAVVSALCWLRHLLHIGLWVGILLQTKQCQPPWWYMALENV